MAEPAAWRGVVRRFPPIIYFAFGLLVATIFVLGAVEIETPPCDRSAEIADWRQMNAILDDTNADLTRIIQGLSR